MGSGQRLNNSLKKHGVENHVREIIEFLPSREELCDREAKLVTEETLKDPFCMNLMPGGTARKFPAGEDTRMRMRLAKLGKKQSPELIEKRRQACIGRIQTEETREKLRKIARDQWERRYAGDETAIGKRVGQLSHKNRKIDG